MSLERSIRRMIRRVKNKQERLHQKDRRFSVLRLTIVGLGLALIIAALYLRSDLLSGLAVFLLLIVFGTVGFFHKQLRVRIKKHILFQQIQQENLDRLQLNWDTLPEVIEKPFKNHPFVMDLDIFGRFSLLRLLDTTASKQASKRLAGWLSAAEPETQAVLMRQKLVKELRSLHIFRRKFRHEARLVSEEKFDGDKLLRWLNQSIESKMPAYLLPLLLLFAFSTATLAALNRFGFIGPWWSLSLIIYIALFMGFGRFIGNLFNEGLALSDEIRKIENLMKLLHKFRFRNNSRLKQLTAPLNKYKPPVSKKIAALHRLVIFMGLRENPLIRIAVNLVFPVDFILNYFLEGKEKQLAQDLPQWLDILYQLDALSALAGFAALHPSYCFPEFSGSSNAFYFSVKKMSHPLLPLHRKQSNSFRLNKKGETVLITGSNMSGKSTFLRTVGINLVLAYAGSVVDAAEMQTAFFRLQSCIHVDDSLSDGLSYFYAEVKRLKNILTALEQKEARPVFYLIDEIYKGTNNRERLAGSRAYIYTLGEKNGLGIVTTHDLELTVLEKEIEHLQNFHFSEQIHKGKMYFDYQLKPGPCPSTNALKIMEMEGLPVKYK